MLNRFTFINIILVVVLLLLAWQTVQLWYQAPKEVGSSPTRKTPGKIGQLPLARRSSPPKDSFRTISDKNLFHPQRKWGEGIKKEEQRQGLFPEEIVPKEITLYGILIYGDQRMAVLGESNIPRQDKGIRKVSVGDSFAGYKVVEISADTVILKNEGQTKTLVLYKTKTDRRIIPSPPVGMPGSPSLNPPLGPGRPGQPPNIPLPEIFRGALQKQ
ncbi:MAG: hypothetical protein A3G93_14810 [Nitrospinae bacterium RIFCSPLOWO2_12_FULL_45_22]|uniref:Type II secretion system protein GspC N-terminal domain-containing protein n=1 Tax=uncultured bacterium Rifle_16ft_4_minimus_4226 TaxID=1665160 RepID=A0A0H4TTJ6_9BACT|nr:hypothetical protein [uncultured bacterium Rifle_16ft_4_minimus_4226]OGW15004.1 MAG: hypothetical protein A3G93_14810 [Nitrospinae bacterium RIFCSPLOWO2_12_FULL_45_22]